ncbi:MAG: hypothetical protein IMW93_05080 [Thermoanaerobacteraceae bacterium]|nr:hypothetical protein [Thermoanaerobacteraceae bacterium]
MSAVKNPLPRVIVWKGGRVSGFFPSSPVDDYAMETLVWAATGSNRLALGDLPPRQGLTWMIQWGGRTWPSSCGGVSTNLLFRHKGESWFLMDWGAPGGKRLKGPGDLIEHLVAIPELEEEKLEVLRNSVILIPFTNITVEYLNLLFIYAGRGYPFRFIDSLGRTKALPQLATDTHRDQGVADFPLYDLEQRVLSLLVVEQGFALVNVSRAAAGLGLPLSVLQIDHGGWLQEIALQYLNPEKDINLFTVPFYSGMDEAVDAFLAYKWESREAKSLPYLCPEKVLAEIPYPSKAKIRRVKDFCRAVYENHGQFPVFLPVLHAGLVIVAGPRGKGE